MIATRRQALLGGAALGLAAATPFAASGAKAKAVDDSRLERLLASFVEEMLAASPETATGVGLDKGPRAALRRRLDDRSRAGRVKQVADYAERARRLRAIPRDSLKGRDLTLYDTVLYALDRGAEGGRFAYGRDRGVPYVVSQQDGMVAITGEILIAHHLIETKDDADAYVARLEQFGDRIDQESEQIRDAAAKGVILPDFLLAATLKQCEARRAQPADGNRLVTSLAERAKARGVEGDTRAAPPPSSLSRCSRRSTARSLRSSPCSLRPRTTPASGSSATAPTTTAGR